MFLSFYIKILKHPSISTLARLRAIHFYILVMRHSRNRAHDRQALKNRHCHTICFFFWLLFIFWNILDEIH